MINGKAELKKNIAYKKSYIVGLLFYFSLVISFVFFYLVNLFDGIQLVQTMASSSLVEDAMVQT